MKLAVIKLIGCMALLGAAYAVSGIACLMSSNAWASDKVLTCRSATAKRSTAIQYTCTVSSTYANTIMAQGVRPLTIGGVAHREPHVSADARGTQRASDRGTIWGTKPVDNAR